MNKPTDKTLKPADFERAAKLLRCEVAAIRAVAAVEAPRGGFFESGRVAILLEGHHFHRLTDGRYDEQAPNISYPHWDRRKYLGGDREYSRFNAAFKLDRDAAMQACSWGKFQIMGFNHRYAGFDDVGSFVDAMKLNEGTHLDAFCAFLLEQGLDEPLRKRDFKRFSLGYNGPKYYVHGYHLSLAGEYDKLSNMA